MNERRTQRLRLAALLVFALATSVCTGLLIEAGDSGVRIATILALPAALLGVFVSGIGWVRGISAQDAELDAASSEILHELGQAIVDAQQSVFAEGIDLPINVGYSRWPSKRRPKPAGTIGSIYEFYKRQNALRLVILGEGGTGKTVLVLEFALQLIRAQLTGSGSNKVIPLRLSLSSLRLDLERDRDPAQAARRIQDWIVRELQAATNQPRYIARALVQRRWVLPLLDGLDEMDSDDAEPENALAVLRGLNYPGNPGRTPAIILCRTERFKRLVDKSPGPEALLESSIIRMLPLARRDVTNYLATQANRIGDPRRWQDVVDLLEADTQSPLSQLLKRPLDLYLLMNSVNLPATNLASLSQDELRARLLERLVPTATGRGVPYISYTDTSVTRWLRTLAQGLTRQAAAGGSVTDIEITKIWMFGGQRLPRLTSGAATLVIGACILLAPFGWARFSRHQWLPVNNKQWFIDTMGCTLVLIAAARASLRKHRVVRLDLSALSRAAGRQRLKHYVRVFFVVGVIFGTFFFFLFGLAFAVAFSLSMAVALGALFGLVRAPALVASPRKYIRDATLADILILSECAVVYGVANGIANGLLNGAYGGLIFGVAYGWLFGSAVRATSPWLRYLLVTWWLARLGRLPRRLGRFFEWGIDVGLLRLSGTRVQFRHSELRDYFK